MRKPSFCRLLLAVFAWTVICFVCGNYYCCVNPWQAVQFFLFPDADWDYLVLKTWCWLVDIVDGDERTGGTSC